MMREIPFGETATYGGMAMAMGSGPRAGGKEGGYSGERGLPTKHQLLALEGVVLL